MNSAPRFVVLALIVGAIACGGGPKDPPAATPAGKRVDPETVGSLEGTVKFEGTPPATPPIRLSNDCLKGNTTPNPVNEAVLVGADGSLKNAFVYVKDGLDAAYTFDTPTEPVELMQRGCIYSPRIFGVRVGQPLDVVNGDPTLHNVHALPMVNEEFNTHQPIKDSRLKHVFTSPEVMVRFKCDVHGWMASYVGVMAHPYFAVSDATGHFTIDNLPPGDYTLEAWHETFGRKTAKVNVSSRATSQTSFTFTAVAK